MTATNHALTGAIIGLTISNPVIAIIVAFLSHFVLDAIPHFDVDHPKGTDDHLKTPVFRIYLLFNFVTCVLLVAYLFIFSRGNWVLPSVCAFAAASPDFLSINHYLTVIRNKKWRPAGFMKFASKIQWFERPSGAIVEIVWFGSCVWILSVLLAS